MNFEDPEILKLMVGKKMKKNWKETYGFDFVAYGGDKSEVSFSKILIFGQFFIRLNVPFVNLFILKILFILNTFISNLSGFI